ncbi:unnamed protein product [Discosporangium mesarthrocarpum]
MDGNGDGPPATKRQRSIDIESSDSSRTSVVKGGLSILCSTDAMGMLIGKGGVGLRDMQEKSGCKVSLQETKSLPEGAKERGVGVYGTFDGLLILEGIILEKLAARRSTSLAPSPAEDQYELELAGGANGASMEDPATKVVVDRWLIPNSHCGWLIGKGGSGIQNIESLSHAEIRVANEKAMAKGGTDRMVYIKGNLEQRTKAIELIRDNPKVGGRPATEDEPEVAAVHVPARSVGYILGHAGVSIKALTEKTGARMQVAPSNELTTGTNEHRVRNSHLV